LKRGFDSPRKERTTANKLKKRMENLADSLRSSVHEFKVGKWEYVLAEIENRVKWLNGKVIITDKPIDCSDMEKEQ